jgi:hypothetical protein
MTANPEVSAGLSEGCCDGVCELQPMMTASKKNGVNFMCLS